MEPEGYDNGERREQRIHRLLLPCRYDRREARVGSRMLLVSDHIPLLCPSYPFPYARRAGGAGRKGEDGR